MRQGLLRYRAVAFGAGVSLLFGATLRANTTPVDQIRQAGATAVVYQGPQLDVAVSYKFPRLNPEGKWLLLDTTMAARKSPLLIPRSAISVRTPDGTVVPLASSSQYFKAYPQLAWNITRDNAIREPLGLPIPRRYRPLRYFPPRGFGLTFDAAWVDYWHDSYGRLFFELPGGVHKGRYELLINLTESKVVIPFTL
jgi:hypothetical protein